MTGAALGGHTFASVQGGPGRITAHESDLEIATCRRLCENGQVAKAVDELNSLVQRGCYIPNNLFYHVLKRCISKKDLVLGRRVHSLTDRCGYGGNAFLATHLIGLYASQGRLEEAIQVFSRVAGPSLQNWSAIIFAYARHGEPAEAIGLYRRMRQSDVKPDSRIFVAVLKACATAGDLAAGKDVHAHILAAGGVSDMFVQTSLIDMYAKCKSLADARSVFDSSRHKNVVMWTAMIAGYAKQGIGQEALCLYGKMQHEGIIPPDSVTFVCLLQACASVGVVALHYGKQLHVQIEDRGVRDDAMIDASLINMYAKCGSLEDARKVFDGLNQKTVVAWTTMIAGYAHQGMGQEALALYSSMQQGGVTPLTSITFMSLLHACASGGPAALQEGKQLHKQITEQGMQDDLVVGGSLVNMYSKCNSLQDARRVFDSLPHKNVVTWNAMIGGYAQQGLYDAAFSVYSSMEQEGITPPDSVTFVCLLQACATAGAQALHQGNQLHAQIEEQGLQDDEIVGATLVNMYAKCGDIASAQRVFDRLSHKNVVTWTSIIAAYVQQGMGQEALKLHNSMRQEGLIAPNVITFVCLLQACASMGSSALHHGKDLHAEIEKQGLQGDVVVGGSLVNMYAKCSRLEDARKLFDLLPNKDVVTWNAMIASYAQQGLAQEALGLYSDMQQEGVTQPDSVTFVSLLQACGTVGALPLGKQLHAQIADRHIESDVDVGSSLVYMYAKCGSLEDAQQVFNLLPVKETKAWAALIAGYTHQGNSEVVFNLLDRMRLEGAQADTNIFLNVLTVCSHAGLVDEGRMYFSAMSSECGLTPTIEHYTCMMDLLGRAGHLEESLQIAKTMPYQPDGAVWRTLLASCQKWCNVEVGRQAFESALQIDEKDAAAFVLMSNIYAGAQMWEEAEDMQARRVNCGAGKQAGQCWCTDMAGVTHTFVIVEGF